MPPRRQLLLQVAFLGLCYAIVFTGFSMAVSFMTTIFPGSFGFIALCVTYLFFAVGSLCAPSIVHLFERIGGKGRGEKLSMVLAGATYVFLIFTLISKEKWLAVLGTISAGFGNGIIWISQGVYVTKAINHFKTIEVSQVEDVIGIVTGVFFTIYSLSGIFGNLSLIFLLQSGVGMTITLWSMFGVVGLGTILFFFVKRSSPDTSEEEVQPLVIHKASLKAALISEQEATHQSANTSSIENPPVKEESSKTCFVEINELWKFARLAETQFLTPICLCQGVNIAYTFGNYPNFLTAHSADVSPLVNSDEMARNIAIGFLLYGAGSIIGSLGWGKLYDAHHERLRPLAFSHIALFLANTIILFVALFLDTNTYASMILLWILGFSYGLVDFLTNAVINNSVSKLFQGKNVDRGFAWYRFCFCIGFAGASALSAAIPVYSQNAISLWERYGWLTIFSLNLLFAVWCILSTFRLDLLTTTKIKPREQ